MSERPRIARLDGSIPTVAARLLDHVELASDGKNLDGVVGLAADALIPAITVAELSDAAARDGFYVRVFTHHRLRTALMHAARPGDALVRAQATHKFLYMAHSPQGQKRLGRLVAGSTDAETYLREAMTVLRSRPTRGTHANAMQHMLGYLDHLSAERKHEILGAIARYVEGEHDRSIPMHMLRADIRDREVDDWIAAQVYLDPYPAALRD